MPEVKSFGARHRTCAHADVSAAARRNSEYVSMQYANPLLAIAKARKDRFP
jgi:hypothetical protein